MGKRSRPIEANFSTSVANVFAEFFYTCGSTACATRVATPPPSGCAKWRAVYSTSHTHTWRSIGESSCASECARAHVANRRRSHERSNGGGAHTNGHTHTHTSPVCNEMAQVFYNMQHVDADAALLSAVCQRDDRRAPNRCERERIVRVCAHSTLPVGVFSIQKC